MRVNYLTQLSQSLPSALVGFDAQWPKYPLPLKDAANGLKEMYRMTLVRRFMRKLSPEDRAQVSQSSSVMA